MNKKVYNNAMDKIKASRESKDNILISITEGVERKKRLNINKVIGIAVMFLIVISGIYFTTPSRNPINSINKDEFQITGETDSNMSAEYILVLYLDGYSYEGSGWIHYDPYNRLEDVEQIKGNKIGQVTLDLKGKIYEGTPPDFSSTFGVGAEVYELKDIKRENAVLIVSGEIKHILYRTRKALASANESIDLKVKEVVNMITDYPIIKEVELRDEINGSWMRTSNNESLINLLNTEIQDLDILNYEAMNRPKGESSYRIPVNFMFEDGAVLHAQVYPETNIMYIFGGYINISDDLASEFEELFKMGNQYSRLNDIISYDWSNIQYFQLDNNITGESIVSIEPQWSGEALHHILSYYSVDKSPRLEGRLVTTIIIGESEMNSKGFNIYEGEDGNLFFEVDGEFYKIIKGKLMYQDILDIQQNYTSI